VALYGLPCRVDIYAVAGGFVVFDIRYHGILARYYISASATRYARADYRLLVNTPAREFWLVDRYPEECKGTVGLGEFERWLGFTSAYLYTVRNQRALGVK
jgi:hypothetical protein